MVTDGESQKEKRTGLVSRNQSRKESAKVQKSPDMTNSMRESKRE